MSQLAYWVIRKKADPVTFWVQDFGWSLHLEPTRFQTKQGVKLPLGGEWCQKAQEEVCRVCGAAPGTPEYGTVGDGYDGMCPSCADQAEVEED